MAKKPAKKKLSLKPAGFVDGVGTVGKWYTTWITGAAIFINAAQTSWIVLKDDTLMSAGTWGAVNILLLALNQFASTIKQELK